MTDTRRYGKARAQAWDRLHPRLTRRAARTEHDGPLPIITGTVIRLTVKHLPSRGEPTPVWLWWSKTDAAPADVDRCWQTFLRRFDIEHTRTPNYAWHGPSPRTYADRGNAPSRRSG